MAGTLSLPSGASWFLVGPWLVGATFLWAGAVKAISPHVFYQHVSRLGWIPGRHVRSAVTAAAGLEGAWGVVLILGVAPALILPATALLLVVLTATSWWGVKSGRTTDCGCYGGYVVPSLAQGILINAAFAALVMSAWLMVPRSGFSADWKLAVTFVVGILFAALAAASLRFLRAHGRLMLDTSPLKAGHRWRARWGARGPDDAEELLVSFLGPDCPYCRQWVRVLNAMHKTPGLPRVVGVVATSKEKLETFVENSGIVFPMTTIPQTLMSRLVWAVPTTVLVGSGRIQKQWGGHMPPEFFHRFKRAFFPAAPQPPSIGEKRTPEPEPARR